MRNLLIIALLSNVCVNAQELKEYSIPEKCITSSNFPNSISEIGNERGEFIASAKMVKMSSKDNLRQFQNKVKDSAYKIQRVALISICPIYVRMNILGTETNFTREEIRRMPYRTTF